MSDERKDVIKPVAIWTVIMTGVTLSLIKVFGDGYLMTHDINVKYPYLEKEMQELLDAHKACEIKMDSLLLDVHNHHNRIDTVMLRVDRCEGRMENCEKQHRKYHHGMKD